jgi:hypothetical protein
MAKDVVATLLIAVKFDHISLDFFLINGDMPKENYRSLVRHLHHLLFSILNFSIKFVSQLFSFYY